MKIFGNVFLNKKRSERTKREGKKLAELKQKHRNGQNIDKNTKK